MHLTFDDRLTYAPDIQFDFHLLLINNFRRTLLSFDESDLSRLLILLGIHADEIRNRRNVTHYISERTSNV